MYQLQCTLLTWYPNNLKSNLIFCMVTCFCKLSIESVTIRQHTLIENISLLIFCILKTLLFKDLKAILKSYSSSEKKAGLENKELNMTRNVLPGCQLWLLSCFIYWHWCLYITFDHYTLNWHFSGQIQSVSDVTRRRQGRLLQWGISICT